VTRGVTTTHQLQGPIPGSGLGGSGNTSFQRLIGGAFGVHIPFSIPHAPILEATFRVVGVFSNTSPEVELSSHTTDPATRIQQGVISIVPNGANPISQAVSVTAALEALRLAKTDINLTAGVKAGSAGSFTIYEIVLTITWAA
jgi:hypothetical protein